MVLILCDKWAPWTVEHFFFFDMASRMIPKFHLCYSDKSTLLASESLYLSLRIYPWYTNAGLLFLSFNHLLSQSWRYHVILTKVCLKLYYVFGDKITLSALLVRAVGSVVVVEVNPSEREQLINNLAKTSNVEDIVKMRIKIVISLG
jgi:hypothetical protein